MALKSRATKAEFVSGDNSLKLTATFHNLEKLREYTDQPPLQFIGTVLAPLGIEEGAMADVDQLASNVCSLFYCLQDGDDYAYGEIYDAFFGNTSAFFKDQHNILNLMAVIGHIMGEDISEQIAQLEKKLNEPPKKGKSTSTSSTQHSAT